jgi:hypothetical protein
MSKTLAVIMLDFFVMISIAFFILQFIQPSETQQSLDRPKFMRITITFEKTPFLQSTEIPSRRLQDLIDVGVVASMGKDYHGTGEFSRLYSQESVSFIYFGVVEGNLRIFLFCRQFKSIGFASTKPRIGISISIPGRSVPPISLASDFLHNPYIMVPVQ